MSGDSDDGRFGGSLAAGDFGGEKLGLEDLAISAQAGYYDTSGGAVIILYARSKGLAGTQSEIFTQDTVGVEDEAEPGDGFGRTLAAGDFDSQGANDLAIGAPFEDREGEDIGAVNVLYSSSCASLGSPSVRSAVDSCR